MKKLTLICLCIFSLMLLANSVHSEPTIIDSALVEHLQEISEKTSQQPQTAISTLNTQLSQPTAIDVPIIVTLTDIRHKDEVINLLNQNNAKIKHIYELIDAIALDIPHENIQNIASDTNIKGIYLDKKIQIPKPDERTEQEMQELRKKGKFTPLLNEGTKAIGAPFVWDNGIDGTGITIAVLDTGIDKNHPGLKDKIILERDFTLFDNRLDSSDGYGHGTHCAGIIAGSGAGSTIFVDTISTDTSGLTNIPNPELTPHVGMVELDDVYNVLLTKWIFKITPDSKVYNHDLPSGWWGYDTDDYVLMVQKNENYTLDINRNETQIYDFSIDGGKSWITGKETADGVKIETGSKKLYLDTAATRPNSLKDVKPVLSENDLDLLAKQTITYEDGTTTTMNQEIDLTANTKVRFSEDDATGKTDTPRLILYNAAYSLMYTLNLTFPTGLDISDSDDSMTPGPGIADQDIMIMGKPFIVGAQDDISVTKLVLFSGGEKKTLVAGGDPIAFDLDGETHTIRMTSWTGTGPTLRGVFLLDGVQYEKAENSEITVNPVTGSRIRIMKLTETKIPSPDGGDPIETAQAKILIGSTKLTLEDNQEVKKGDNIIPGANAAFSYSGTEINKIEISYTPGEDMTSEEGVAYQDPILEAFDFVLTGTTPDLKSLSTDKIIIAADGNKIVLSVPLKDGNTLTVDVMETGTDYFTPKIDGNKFFVSDTQDEVKNTDYVLVSDGEYSSLLQFKSMNNTDNILTFSDIGSGDDIEIAYADCIGSGASQTDCAGTMYIGTTSYNITDIDEDDNTIDIDAYSGAEYTQNIPFISRNGANVTLVTGTHGMNYTKGIITISEIDTTEIESDGTGVVLEISAATESGSDEIESISITANEPAAFMSVGDRSTNRGVTSYGTMVEDDADRDTITMWYPDEQASADVYVMKTGVSPSSLDTPDIGTLNWGNTTINFKTGTDGFVEIASDYNLIYLDEDGDFNTMLDQMKAFENEHLKKYSFAYSGSVYYNFWYSTEYIVSQIDSKNNNMTIGLDINLDNQPDIFKGVAPAAQLLNGKVLSDGGLGYDSGIIAGIEWAVQNEADVISMSLGGWQNICDGNDPLAKATEKAWDMGTVVVIAAGNSGWMGTETITTPGCAKKVITVGASSKYAQSEQIASSSSIGPTADGRIKPELVAPGISIISARSGNTDMGLVYTPHYTSASGTSMAAPHVAGAAALLKQTDPNLTPDEIKEILMNTAEDFGERVFVQGAGLINVSDAHELADKSRILAAPSLLNLIVQNNVPTTISLNTALNDPALSAIDEIGQIVDIMTDYGHVNSAAGFNYAFYIPDNVSSFSISINWNNSSNDVDMILYDPENLYYSGSYGLSNSESIFVYKSREGLWRLHVYPYSVSEEVNVTITLKTYEPKNWDWFTYSGNELTITPDVDISGLYAGKIKLDTGDEDVMIPASIIVSEPIGFSSYATHNDFGSDICGRRSYTYSIQTVEEEPEPVTRERNQIASFDGYFCSSNERRAFSFEVPPQIPYVKISLWIRDYNTLSYNDLRLFVYDPTGKEYDVSDLDGSIEKSYLREPLEGNWTIVIASEKLYLEDDAGLQFSGEIWYPGMAVNLKSSRITLEPNETTNVTINLTNFMDSDFLLNSIESKVMVETPLDIVPNSDIDKNNTLGPFSNSYRYYNFNITQEQLNDNEHLKFEAHLDTLAYLNTFELYIFDGNGTLVEQSMNTYGSDISGYLYLTDYYSSGLWTIVLVGEGLYYEEYPFDLNIWVVNEAECDWISVINRPTDYFTDTEEISLSIRMPDNTAPEYHSATISLTGDWYSGEDHEVSEGSGSYTIPLMIYLAKPINISLDIDKQKYSPTEEIIAKAQLTNTEEYLYKETTGTVFWQIAYENDTTIISEIENVHVFGGESIDLTQNWRANILEPGDYILTLIYNYTDYRGENWTAEASKQFNVALVNVNIPKDSSINITEGELTLQIKVGDSTDASVNLIKHLNNPANTTPSGMTDWSKFIQIEVNDDLEGNMNWAMIKMHYNDSEISAAGIDENTLKMYYLNETLNEWTACENTGVNVIDNYVWANVTHFSHYGSFASIPEGEDPPDEENNNLGGGSSRTPAPTIIQSAACTEDWTCTEWSSCETNRQIRTCTDQNDCATEENKSAESQTCEIEPKTPKHVPTQDTPDNKEKRVLTSSDRTAQEDMGPTGLAASTISKYAPGLDSIMIVLIAIIVGIFLRAIFMKKNRA